MAFDRIDPIGDIRGDLRIARLCQIIGAAAGAELSIDDVILKFGAEPEPPKPEGITMTGDTMKMIFTLAGETVVDNRPGHGGSR